MTKYKLHEWAHLYPGDYWVQYQKGKRWYPCVLGVALVGIEYRVELRSGWFETQAYWPEDPTMHEPVFDEMVLMGPMEQPDEEADR